MDDDEAFKEKEGEDAEVEILNESNSNDAGNDEVRAPNKRSTLDHEKSHNKAADKGKLKTHLSNIVRVKGPEA